MTPDKDAQETPGPSPIALLRPIVLASLWRFRWLLVLGVLAGAGFGVFRGLVAANQFKSMGKLYVRPGVRESMAADTVIYGGEVTTRAGGSREAVQIMMQALSAPEYYQKVVERIGAGVMLAPYDPAKQGYESGWHKQLFHSFQSWWFAGDGDAVSLDSPDVNRVAAFVLMNTLWLVPEPGSSVIAFHYVSHSPELAKQVVDTSLEVAIEWHQQVFKELSSQAKLESELKEAEAAATEAETKLRSFRREKSVNDYAGDHQRLVEYIAELERAIDKIDIDTKALAASLQAQSERLAGLTPRHPRPDSQQWVDNPDHLALSASRNKLREDLLAADRGEGSADEKRARRNRFEEQIKDLEAQLAKLPVKVLTSPIEVDNPAYLSVKELVAGLQVDLRGKQSERSEMATTLANSRKRLDELEKMAPDLRALEEEYRQKRTFADGITENVGKLRAVQRLEEKKVSSVGVLHKGTEDGIRIAPRRGMLVAMGVVGGLGAAMALAVLLALFDRRVRYREDLPRLGVPMDGVLVSGGGGSGMPWMLPSSLAEIRDDIARFWAALPYERRQAQGLRIGFVPCGEGASAGRAAAALALGLAAHGGEKVCYVATLEGPTWLGQRLGLDHQCGWSEVLRGEFQLEDAVVATPVKGLHYLPAGKIGPVVPHPMAGPAFVALLDRLAQTHRFVIVELPDVGLRPEGRSVLGVMDGAQLVVCRLLGTKASVREAIGAVQTAGARLLGGVLQPPAIAPAPARAAE